MKTLGKLNDRMARAIHHREQLDAIAADMAEIVGVAPESVAGRYLRQAAYGELTLNEALQRVTNLKLAELATIEVEGVE